MTAHDRTQNIDIFQALARFCERIPAQNRKVCELARLQSADQCIQTQRKCRASGNGSPGSGNIMAAWVDGSQAGNNDPAHWSLPRGGYAPM